MSEPSTVWLYDYDSMIHVEESLAFFGSRLLLWQVLWRHTHGNPGRMRTFTSISNMQIIPMGSMHSIFTYIYPKNSLNVRKYTIHGASGIYTPIGTITYPIPFGHFWGKLIFPTSRKRWEVGICWFPGGYLLHLYLHVGITKSKLNQQLPTFWLIKLAGSLHLLPTKCCFKTNYISVKYRKILSVYRHIGIQCRK